jgi:integrase/recombinase XerD
LPEVLSPDDVRRVLRLIHDPRYRLCLALMYACGLRIGEAATVTVTQIDGAKGLLRIVGKGNKERLVPLPSPLLDKLRDLWKTHRHPRWLFPNRLGTRPVAAKNLRVSFRAAVSVLGLPASVVPHSLRHSYATQLLERGVELRIVQILLGHASMRSTAVYTHLTEPGREHLHVLLNELMAGL